MYQFVLKLFIFLGLSIISTFAIADNENSVDVNNELAAEAMVALDKQVFIKKSVAEFGQNIFSNLFDPSENLMFAPGNMAEALFLLSNGVEDTANINLQSQLLKLFGNGQTISIPSDTGSDTNENVQLNISNYDLLEYIKNSAKLASQLTPPKKISKEEIKELDWFERKEAESSNNSEELNLAYALFLDSDKADNCGNKSADKINNLSINPNFNEVLNSISENEVKNTNTEQIKVYKTAEVIGVPFTKNSECAAKQASHWGNIVSGGLIPQYLTKEAIEEVQIKAILASSFFYSGIFTSKFHALNNASSDTDENTSNNDDSNFSSSLKAPKFFPYINSSSDQKTEALKDVQYMQQTENLMYSENQVAQMVSVGFVPHYNAKDFDDIENKNKSIFTLDIVIPDSQQNLKDFAGKLLSVHSALVTNLGNEYIKLSIPKLKINAKKDITNLLSTLGLKHLTADNAVNRIRSEKDGELTVSNVKQDTAIEMTETGFKAASISSVVMVERSVSIPQTPIEINVDGPYFMILRNTLDDSVHFMIYINNPEFTK